MSRLAASGSRVMEWPPMKASPALGATRPLIMEMVVVLPAPLGPSRLKISPRRIVRFTSLTAWSSLPSLRR